MRLHPLQGTPDVARRFSGAVSLPRSPEGSRARLPLPFHQLTLVEFFAPPTRKPRRVHSTPVCQADYVPPSGFLTLSTACSSPERPALFHAGNVHGVSLSRDFPSLSGPVASALGIPSWRCSSALNECYNNIQCGGALCHAPGCVTEAFRRLQGFAPTANPYRGWSVSSGSDGRFPPELLCRLSRASTDALGHVARPWFAPALHPFDLPPFPMPKHRSEWLASGHATANSPMNSAAWSLDRALPS
jgi:hypothetical protein